MNIKVSDWNFQSAWLEKCWHHGGKSGGLEKAAMDGMRAVFGFGCVEFKCWHEMRNDSYLLSWHTASSMLGAVVGTKRWEERGSC